MREVRPRWGSVWGLGLVFWLGLAVPPGGGGPGVAHAYDDPEEDDYSDEEELSDEVLRRRANRPKKPKKVEPRADPVEDTPVLAPDNRGRETDEDADARGKDRSKDTRATDQNRCQAFAAGLSDDLRHKAGEVTNILRGVLRAQKGITVLDLADRLKAEPPPKTREFQDQARRELKEAKKAFQDMEFPKVTEHAVAAREAFEKMGGYLDPLERYKESLLLIAVSLSMQGDQAGAKAAFLDLLLLDPHVELPRANYEAFVIEQLNKTRQTLDSQARGSLSIKTNPPGANLYLDGKLRGVTPTSQDGLLAGRHLVIVKQPGYENFGKVVTIEGGELLSLNEKLVAGKAGGGFLQLVDRACRKVGDGDSRGDVLNLGSAIGMDWAVLGLLAHDDPEIVLRLYFFEFGRGEVMHQAKLNLERSDYGQEEEVRRFAATFLDRGLRKLKEFREKGDPLSSRSGTEDWNRDDGDGARRRRDDYAREETTKQKKSGAGGDPLDDRDGTEDW
jgi:hypothetical protein